VNEKKEVMFKNEIRLVIENSIGIPSKYKSQIFEIEKATFENTYERCPKTMAEFEKRYNNKKLYIVLGFHKEKIIGFRLFEKINDIQIQSMFMVVVEKYRGLKISTIICAFSYEYFKWLGFKYITSWTHIDITASKILAKFAPYLSTTAKLNKEEIRLLNNFENYIGKPKGYYGSNRRVKRFYNMLNNEVGDAMFWVHLLS
jgi:hypothetical protein